MKDTLLHLNRRTVLAWAAASPLATSAAFAQGTADPMVEALLALLQPGADARSIEAFRDNWLSPAGQRRWPGSELERYIGGIATRSGGVDLLSIRRSATDVRLQVRTRRRGIIRVFRIRLDRDDQNKIFDLPTFPIPTPYDGPVVEGPLSEDLLRAIIERRTRFAVEKNEFSGAVRVVAPSGHVVYAAAFGSADGDTNQPNTTETRFHLGSADKSFTALIIARLIQDGRLTWDKKLGSVLPDYPNPAFAADCTIRHLASHTSGLGGLFDRPRWDNLRPYDRMDELFHAFASEPPAFSPGSAGAYSNEGFIVLGAVAEKITGQSWYDLLSEWIYRPAGMASSGHFPYADLPTNVARGYRFADEDHMGLDGRRANSGFLGYRGNSCGGGYATVSDMTAYLRALREGAIIPLSALDQMIKPSKPGIADYGLGFITRRANSRTIVGHGGGGPHSGIDGMNGLIWETGWAFSILGNFDAPFAGALANDVGAWLSLQT